MDSYFVEVYRKLRDTGKPISERDAADFREIRAPQPPSRGHLKQFRRDHDAYRDKARDPNPSPETLAARARLAYFKRQMSQAPANERTIKPAAKAPRPKLRYVTVIEPVQKRELYPEPKPVAMAMTEAQALAYDKNALFRAYERGGDVDLAEVSRLFSSIDCWKREVQAWLDR